MKELSRFDDFLINADVYDQNELFWQGILLDIIGDLPCNLQWMNTAQNGEKWRFGNPMFTAYFPTLKRGIRIIQKDKKNMKPATLRTWISDSAYIENDTEVDIWELVIGLTLTEENVEASEYLVKKWIDENTSLSTMKEIISGELAKI